MNLDAAAIHFYANEPVYFVEDIIRAKPDKIQRDILYSVRDYPMTSVRSGHGIGKTAVESWCIIWYLLTRPFPKIPCTAPTKHQLYDILWSEVSKWIRNSPVLQREIIWTQEKIYLNGYAEEWFAVARTATNPDALQGFHSDYILFIIDEASGVSDRVFEPVLGAMTSDAARLLMMGNPTRISGFFYASHHKNRSSYNAMHADGRDSCRVSGKFVQKIIEMFGEDSDVFRVRVAGQFPKSNPDSFIAVEWCEHAAKISMETKRQRIDIGVDVARYGDDSSVLYPVFDRCVSGDIEIYHHNRTTEIAGHVVQMVKRYAVLLPRSEYYIKIDCDGLGVGVYDNLYEQREQIIEDIWREECIRAGHNPDDGRQLRQCDTIPKITLEICECHFGGAGGKLGDDDPIEYSNNTGLMWGSVRRALKDGTLQIPDNDMLIEQLCNRRYTVNADGKIELERKESMKKRGLKSPDMADALALAMYDTGDRWQLVGL